MQFKINIFSQLGALQVCDEVVNLSKKMRIISKVIDDETAVRCCNLFLRDHQFLVEPACGATLSPLYTGKVASKFIFNTDTFNFHATCS